MLHAQRCAVDSCRHRSIRLGAAFLAAIMSVSEGFAEQINGTLPTSVSQQYRRFFVKYEPTPGMISRALAGLAPDAVGRSLALIVGVGNYPKMSLFSDRKLEAATNDLKNLTEFLTKDQDFDEVVVLQDNDVTKANLSFFLDTYFPGRVESSPRSRFLFAYSGHGVTDVAGGRLVLSTAASMSDMENSIPLRVLKANLAQVVERGHQSLILLNACYSGLFLHQSAGPTPPISRQPGALAIVSTSSDNLAWGPSKGGNSYFFDAFLRGARGEAESDDNGVITSLELLNYVVNDVSARTQGQQLPEYGDLLFKGSRGQFFFFQPGKKIASSVVRALAGDASPAGLATTAENAATETPALASATASSSRFSPAVAKPALSQPTARVAGMIAGYWHEGDPRGWLPSHMAEIPISAFENHSTRIVAQTVTDGFGRFSFDVPSTVPTVQLHAGTTDFVTGIATVDLSDAVATRHVFIEAHIGTPGHQLWVEAAAAKFSGPFSAYLSHFGDSAPRSADAKKKLRQLSGGRGERQDFEALASPTCRPDERSEPADAVRSRAVVWAMDEKGRAVAIRAVEVPVEDWDPARQFKAGLVEGFSVILDPVDPQELVLESCSSASTGWPVSGSLSPGPHAFRLSAAGFADRVITVSPAPGKSVFKVVTLSVAKKEH